MPIPENRLLSLAAPAKINLVLKVTARRPDGYHELETWMQKVTLFDRITLTIRKGEEIRLKCIQGTVPSDETNLAWKAAAAFFAESRLGVGCGVDIVLDKKIPVAAGLGGGSSDAGTVLKGLNTLFDNEFPDDVLLEYGRRLGADVPFFVTGYGAVSATGIGERMKPVRSLTDHTFLLINPGFSVSTRWVYENYALTTKTKNSRLSGFRKSNTELLSFAEMTNDLEQVTISRYPELQEIKQKLRDAGAVAALMSGSGPTVFGIFPDAGIDKSLDPVQYTAERLHREYGENVFVVKAYTGA